MSQSSKSRTTSTASRREFLKVSTAIGAAVAAPMAIIPQTQAATGAPASGGQIRRRVKAGPVSSRGCTPEIRAALSGPWPTIRTPFTRQGEIDWDALRKRLDFMIDAKAKAVVLTWGDSLFSVLSDDEIAQLTKVVVKHVNGRAFVVAATNRWGTGQSVQFARYCVELGADMLMGFPPDRNASTTVDSLVDYYAALAEHLPVMVVTGYLARRGIKFSLELCRRLCNEVPGVMAVKDDVCGEFICKICLLTHDRWALAAGGQKQNHMLMYPYGVDGYLSTFITFKPEIAWRYWKAIRLGDIDAASAVIRDYDMPFFDYIIGVEGSFDAAIRGIYELCGLGTRYSRAPYHSLTDKQMEELAGFLKEKGIL